MNCFHITKVCTFVYFQELNLFFHTFLTNILKLYFQDIQLIFFFQN